MVVTEGSCYYCHDERRTMKNEAVSRRGNYEGKNVGNKLRKNINEWKIARQGKGQKGKGE